MGVRKETWLCDICKANKKLENKDDTSGAVTQDFMKQLFDEKFGSLSKQMRELQGDVAGMSGLLDEALKNITDLQNENKKLIKNFASIEADNANLKTRVSVLENKINEMEQYSRRMNIQIDGIPVTQGEKVDDIVEKLGNLLEVASPIESVLSMHRVPSINAKKCQPIIVQFSNPMQRRKWLEAYRKKRDVTSTDLNPVLQPKTNIYINEHLTRENKTLLAATKAVAKERGYQFVWVRQAKIYVRKEHNSKAVRIFTHDGLQKLV
ncbi:uncharacterized protein LOC120356269 [Nilaparvata lugens]|uniref:uncharacterized protein LOC111046851 n=2 Tax=Nilaparvata lugens TaxID=108931 RepID=UPI000B98AE9D|nr:uncharacterized protein LOC111046851 [Nilaparvata lugens]XP_039301115.1 uncharacterized protein LOC120356269 [Nilaparvata lugens]